MARNPNIDDDTRERAMRWVESQQKKSSPSQRIVSKKELEASGLSLRDFLNRERGLTRRKDKTDPTMGDSSDQAAQDAADRMGADYEAGLNMRNYKPRRTPSSLTEVTRPGKSVNYENTDVSDMGMRKGGSVKKMAKGGAVKGWGAARGARKAKIY